MLSCRHVDAAFVGGLISNLIRAPGLPLSAILEAHIANQAACIGRQTIHYQPTRLGLSFGYFRKMSSDEELDPLTAPGHYTAHQRPSIQNLLFPRGKSIVYATLASPSPRRNSYRASYPLRPEYIQQRSQLLLERNNCPPHSWEHFRKSDDDLKAIKNKKIRKFYEDQVLSPFHWPLIWQNSLIDDLLLVDYILESPVPSNVRIQIV